MKEKKLNILKHSETRLCSPDLKIISKKHLTEKVNVIILNRYSIASMSTQFYNVK